MTGSAIRPKGMESPMNTAQSFRTALGTLLSIALLLGSLSATLSGAHPAVAATSSGAAYAWGSNSNGQLGNGTTNDSLTPMAVNSPTGLTVTASGAGFQDSLAIGSNGKLYAWGNNASGQLGNGTTKQSSIPVAVSLPSGMTPLALGTGSQSDHSLAVLTSSAPTAAILSSFHAIHTGGAIRFHWRVASGAGLRGFFLTAGTHRLNRMLIAVDAHRQSYAYRSRWQGHGPYLLHGILQGRAVVTLATTG